MSIPSLTISAKAVELSEYSQTQHKKDSLKQNAGKDTTKVLVDAARYMLDGIRNRPPEVEISEENADEFATIESCLINTETGKIDVTMLADALAISDDGYYYLFAEKTYEDGIGDQEYIIEDQKDTDLTFSVNLNYNTVSSRLFSKFVVAVKKNGKYVAITKPHYVTMKIRILCKNGPFRQPLDTNAAK